jgi:hypothetical protein
MHAVATGAVRGEGRSVLCGETMVTFEKGRDAILWKIVLRVETLGRVAFAADLFRYFKG